MNAGKQRHTARTRLVFNPFVPVWKETKTKRSKSDYKREGSYIILNDKLFSKVTKTKIKVFELGINK